MEDTGLQGYGNFKDWVNGLNSPENRADSKNWIKRPEFSAVKAPTVALSVSIPSRKQSRRIDTVKIKTLNEADFLAMSRPYFLTDLTASFAQLQRLLEHSSQNFRFLTAWSNR